MQQRRPNPERAEATRSALLAAARTLFVEKGYADTSTPEIVAAAKVTRGALYHHYADKADLFRAVIEREAKAVADEIEASASPDAPPGEALLRGSLAYLEAMSVPGRTRLLLVDGPAVLGPGALAALDEAHAARTLREGLEAALRPPRQEGAFIEALTALLSAAFDRAALAIEAGGDRAAYTAAMIGLVERVTASR
ncbi:TetR/AcrR family transcriptional regulator [Microvirga arsenatis]|uniref:TetR family transcriptional regulator n=1 Tax=Microvirga arsenatis TaxID=2692265 RepID=A0ABW9YUH9_9HYPH|nr:TetR family transcriptional regulator [Microvirga arsenatis]NBJ09362.1 TetR family transcriptional regulator [Microvirga arsenatis]NBJ23780.1 TetR family transcriptional regulator [Microvirga arsenatis]